MKKKSIWMICAVIILIVCAVGLRLGQNQIGPEIQETIPTPRVSPSAVESTAPLFTDTPVPTASPVPTITPEPSPLPSPMLISSGPFELPLEGATGYTTIEMNLRAKASSGSTLLEVIQPGMAFQIVREEGGYWYVTNPSFSGYLAHRYCMINLPDVLPSIVYDNTNGYASIIRTSGKSLPGITGQKLYNNAAYNARLGQKEFIMPTLYDMAKKIAVAQKAALKDGNSLKIYEAYRPYTAQRGVVDALNTLAQKDAEVKKGISTAPWKVSWFASQGISNHQRGCAIDVSLVKVEQTQQRTSGAYGYKEVTKFVEYAMPTAMHELSIAAVAFQTPVLSSSQTAWSAVKLASSMNNPAKVLQRYCTEAGLTPLASEWWHFNDLGAYARVKDNAGRGTSVLQTLYSTSPGQ